MLRTQLGDRGDTHLAAHDAGHPEHDGAQQDRIGHRLHRAQGVIQLFGEQRVDTPAEDTAENQQIAEPDIGTAGQ
ncbi:hypothetical protein D3C72_862420 [compost metagenome]